MKTKSVLCSLFLFGICCLQVACEEEFFERIDLQISRGNLIGRIATTVNLRKRYFSFQGIPYAVPPVGDLRFKPPRPYTEWSGSLDATKNEKKCPQKDIIFNSFPSGQEDCLVLNVYTPALVKDDERLNKYPVMFWIHGGGFTCGSGNQDMFGPDFFMEEEVILVTINYRLGVLGFMNLEDEIVSGNMGLKDIVLALKWVKDNIDKFGGDSNKVTIFGTNAGGAAVNLLLYSAIAEGLFNKAICQSGVAKLPQLFGANCRQRAFTLAKLLRKDSTDSQGILKDFKNIQPHEFINAAPRTFDSTEVRDTQKSILPFGPSIENITESGAFLSANPDESFLLNNGNDKIPLMIGYNSKEAIIYLRTLINSPEILDKLNYNFQFSVPIQNLQFKYNSPEYKNVASEIKNFYFNDGILNNSSMSAFVDYVSDGIVYPVDKTVRKYLQISKAPVYYYRFSFDGELNFFKRAVLKETQSLAGASNGDEICYLFKCGRLEDTYRRLLKTDIATEEMLLVKKMVRMWTNFAKFGNPTPLNDDILNGLIWKPSRLDDHRFLDINKDLAMGTNPASRNVEFWDRIYETYSNDVKPILDKNEL